MKKFLLVIGILILSIPTLASGIRYTDIKGVFKNDNGIILVDAGDKLLWGSLSTPQELSLLSIKGMTRSGGNSEWTVHHYNSSTNKLDSFNVTINAVSANLHYQDIKMAFIKSDFIETSELAESIEKGIVKITAVPEIRGLRYLFNFKYTYIAVSTQLLSKKSGKWSSGLEVWRGPLNEVKRNKNISEKDLKYISNGWQIVLDAKKQKKSLKKTILELTLDSSNLLKASVLVTETHNKTLKTVIKNITPLTIIDSSNPSLQELLKTLSPQMGLNQNLGLYQTPIDFVKN